MEEIMSWLARWWWKRRYDVGYADARAQLRAAMADPKIGKVTIERADGDGARAAGWNAALADLARSALRDKDRSS